jgi:catechol 2,3-dioxygenase-like lactoylglutathione lyase family enzyme
MSFIVGLDHVTIQIDEGGEALASALHFYIDLLGLAPLDRPANTDNGRPGAWLQCGPAQQLHICTSSPAPARRRKIAPRGAIRRSGSRTSRDCASASFAAGVEILAGNRFRRQERFFVRDPFGNRLEFVTRTTGRDAP